MKCQNERKRFSTSAVAEKGKDFNTNPPSEMADAKSADTKSKEKFIQRLGF